MSKAEREFLKEIKSFTQQELTAKITEFKTKLHKFKMSNALTPMENPSQLKGIRRDIARMHTELSFRTNNSVEKNVKKVEEEQKNENN